MNSVGAFLSTAALLAVGIGTALASDASFYTETIPAPMASAQKEVVQALSHGHFKVVMNLDILKRIEAKQKVLHIPNLNQGGYADARAIVFCNPFLFSALLNSNWQASSVCPLNLTLLSKGSDTTVIFPRRAIYTHATKASLVGMKIDKMVISSLQTIPGSHP
ncbi:hypothetical protein AB4090_14815 [Acidithiobacillus sp. IBUN Pt1247-S3]|uniref:hypothetical protein n=1 Tax=Acidithiobacillus sp. IBUN Pt1247-S3 TaxID=3166642 RepID=UPI0034E5BE83